MEDLKVLHCNLCFTTIHGENYEEINVTENMVNGPLLKLDVDDNSKHVACNACSPKLFAALKFKLTCFSTNRTINSYAQNTSAFPLDLREIYKKERGSEPVSNDVKICCLCMEPLNNASECTSINKGLVDMLHKVSEMKISMIKEPVMCNLCRDSLTEHCDFLENVEQNIGIISHKQISNTPSSTSCLDVSVKSEAVDSGDISPVIKTECLDIDCGEVKTESEIHGQQTSGQALKYNLKTECESITHEPRMINENSSAAQIYKCGICNIQIKNRGNFESHFESHLLKPKDVSEVGKYKCLNCDYETTRMNCLKRHVLLHNDPSEVQISKCENCSFLTKRKSDLKSHTLINKDPSEVQIYKCEACNCETKHKSSLKTHNMVIHKNPSEVQIYKCESCSYRTKHKRSLISHMLIHKDPSEEQMHKCETCSYQTKSKGNLKTHMLSHKNLSEVQIYKCESCNFRTKYRRSLIYHIFIHKDLSGKPYKCEHCNYRARLHRNLKSHMLVHKNLSKV